MSFSTSFKGKGRAIPESDSGDAAEEVLRRNERLEEALEACRDESLLLEAQLRKAVEELEATFKEEGEMSEGDRRIALLEYEIAYLETSITSAQTDHPAASDPLLTPSQAVVEEEVERGLERTIKELKKALEWEERRGVKEDNNLLRDKVLLRDAEELDKALRMRVRRAERANDELTAEDIISKAKMKTTTITETFSELMGALVAFIDERLAKVDEDEDLSGTSGNSSKGTQGISGIQEFFSYSADDTSRASKALLLKRLLENLMNNAVTSPLDPWVNIDDVPRELVDFLVRAGVVSEHPRDGMRVRLVDFGRRVGE